LIEYLEPGFVSEYCRKKNLTSKIVAKRLESVINKNLTHSLIDKLRICHSEFFYLAERRNALLHAHPITSKDGEQILNYQGIMSKKHHDILWAKAEITSFLFNIDQAEVKAAKILDLLRK